MKKYKSPRIEVVEIEIEETILSDSAVQEVSLENVTFD